MNAKLKEARRLVTEKSIERKINDLPNKAIKAQEDYQRKLREQEEAARLQQQRQSVVFNNSPINRARNEYDKINNQINTNLTQQINQNIYDNFTQGNVEAPKIDLSGKEAQQTTDASWDKIHEEQYRLMSSKELNEKIKTMEDDLFSIDRKDTLKWWDNSQNVFQNIGNVFNKLFREGHRYEDNSEYNKLLEEIQFAKNILNDKRSDEETATAGTLDKITATIVGGFERGTQGINTTVGKILQNDPNLISDSTQTTYNQLLAEKIRSQESGVSGYGLDLIASMSQMIPQMLIGGGYSTGITTAAAFANYGGAAYNEAIQQGASDEQATKFGLVTGSLEVFLEKLLGGFSSIYGQSAFGRVSNKVMRNIIRDSVFRNLVSEASGEFIEEYLQEFLEPIVRNAILEEDNGADFWNANNFSEGFKQLLGQFFNQQNLIAGSMGAISSLSMNAPTSIQTRSTINQTIKEVSTKINENNFGEIALELSYAGYESEHLNEIINKSLKNSTGKTLNEVLEDKINIDMTEKSSMKKIDNKIIELAKVLNTVNDFTDTKRLEFAIDSLLDLRNSKIDQNNTTKVDEIMNFDGTEMTLEEIDNKINEIQKELKNKSLSDELKERLNNGLEALEEAKKDDIFKEEQKPSEIKTEQPEKITKDTQNDQEQLRNTIQENEAKLEELKSNKSQNENQIKELEQELKTLRDEKNNNVQDKQLEKRIASVRRSVDELQQRYSSEQATYGITPDTMRLGQELSKARNRLQDLLSQQKESNSTYNNETNDKINEIKKQIEDLKTQDNTREIEQLENEIEENKNTLNELEQLSSDEIGADIEYSNNAYDTDDKLDVENKSTVVLEEMPKEMIKKSEEIKSLWETTKKNLKKLKGQLVNSWDVIEKIAKKARNRMLIARFNNIYNAGGHAQYAIQYAQTNLNGEKIGQSLKSIFDKLDSSRGKIGKKQYRQMFGDYIYASRQATMSEDRIPIIGDGDTIDRIKEINSEIEKLSQDIDNQKEIKALNKEKLELTKQLIYDAQEIVNELEENHPEFKEFKKDVLQYEKNLQGLLKEAGFLTEDQIQLMDQMYPEYARVYRNVKRKSSYVPKKYENMFKKSDIAAVNSPVKSVKGSKADIIPVEEALAKHTVEIYKACARNMFAKELYDTIGGVNSNLRKEAINNGIITFSNGERALIFYDKGQQKAIPISKEIADLINPDLSEFGLIGKIFEKESKITRDLITNMNAFFAVVNMVTDMGDAPINSKHTLLYLKNYMPAWWQMITNGEKWQQYLAMGGMSTSYFDQNKGFKRKNIVSKTLGAPGNAVEFLGEHLEHVTRFAEFLASLEAGDSVLEAMYNADEVTVNFKKGGTFTKKLSRLGFNYLNAKVLGVYKAYENIANLEGGKDVLKLVTKAAALSIAPALLNDLLIRLIGSDKDKEKYNDLTDGEKNKYYIIPINNTLYKLPKGRISRIVSSGPRRVQQGLFEGEDIGEASLKALKEVPDFASSELDLNTINPFELHSLWPLVNIAKNGKNAKNYFGGDIIPSRYRYNKTTLEDQWEDPSVTQSSVFLSKKAKEWFGWEISPFHLDYLADQKLGFIWDLAEPYMTKEPDKKAWETKFVADSRTSNKYTNEIFDLYDKYSSKDHRNEEEQLLYQYYKYKITDIWDKYAEIRQVGSDETLSQKEKEEKINSIRDKINEESKLIQELAQKGVQNKTYMGEKYKQVGDLVYEKDEDGNWKKMSDKWDRTETVKNIK